MYIIHDRATIFYETKANTLYRPYKSDMMLEIKRDRGIEYEKPLHIWIFAAFYNFIV